MADGIYGTCLRAVWCKVLFTRQRLGISSDSEVVSNTAQIINIRLRVKTFDYLQYTRSARTYLRLLFGGSRPLTKPSQSLSRPHAPFGAPL
ncbi:hypothetical protein M513_08687 [Trichuris suis]|uniref:Uncharacterized protein n=1 Tax=Trichuris suis TaxID=68888 RepID=A0A085LZR4_9BILA|nr:hypothetical protein M513_08687 [Trichuris suis]